MKKEIVAIDFDGTCVTHDFPAIGGEIGAVPVLEELVANDRQLILWTMRDGHYLASAVNWFTYYKIPLFGINENPEQKSWTESPKAYANFYIDDAAVGTPLRIDQKLSPRPFVDWERMRILLKNRGLI